MHLKLIPLIDLIDLEITKMDNEEMQWDINRYNNSDKYFLEQKRSLGLPLPSMRERIRSECRNTTHEFSPESCPEANGIRDLDTERGRAKKLALLKDGPLRLRLFPPFLYLFPLKLTRLRSNISGWRAFARNLTFLLVNQPPRVVCSVKT